MCATFGLGSKNVHKKPTNRSNDHDDLRHGGVLDHLLELLLQVIAGHVAAPPKQEKDPAGRSSLSTYQACRADC
jgi:hypothetical protein